MLKNTWSVAPYLSLHNDESCLPLVKICSRSFHNNLARVTGQPVHKKMISGFQALRQARVPEAGLETATEGSLQISGRRTPRAAVFQSSYCSTHPSRACGLVTGVTQTCKAHSSPGPRALATALVFTLSHGLRGRVSKDLINR
ncbi:hypothetical protein PoB_001031100 [Plakobranchus ocellatus]|uniref:Uncharacterized protein n=1 Tax=Plakobranchus ocellatus TaxID=259542 RepID=A0AAV3YKJ5_9GAST|nr:hypothetical protein PoB_001031100 [Plakobranchus ocellatus]